MDLVTPKKRVLLRHYLKLVVIGLFTAFLILLSTFFVSSPTALAATNSTVNFQARLETSAGAIVPDGNYNISFHLFNAATSSGSTDTGCGTDTNCLWSEQYTYNSGSGSTDARISVANGYLSVNLGSITAFPTTINWNQQLWLSMDIGGTSGSSVTWDGQMSPRLQLTGVPYAFQAGQLAQYNGTTGYTSTLSLLQPTVGNQVFQVPDMAAAGTYTLLTTQTANGSYIQNQNSAAQSSSNFWISGTGTAGTSLQTPILDAASTGGTLAIGSTNANTGNVNIGTGATTGNIAVGGSSQTGNISITTGGGTINIGSSAPARTVNIANGSGTQTINIGGSGANPISIGNTQAGGSISVGGALTTGTIAIGSTGQTGSLTLQGDGIADTITGATSNPTDILKAASTSAFQVQNSSGYNELNVNTSGNKVTLGDSGHSIAGSLVFADGTTDGFGATLNTATLTANETISLPDTAGAGGVICLQSSSACGFIQNQSSTAQSANLYIQGSSSTAATAVLEANNGGSGDILDLQNGSGTPVLTIDKYGNVTIEPSTTSAYALQVYQAGGSANPEFRVGGGQAILGFSTGLTGQLEFLNSTNNNHLVLQSGVTGSATLTLTLPTAFNGAGSCLTDSTGSGVLAFSPCESTTGTDFIQNQNAGVQTANFNISGTGTAGVLHVSSGGSGIDTATTSGVLNIGTNNATTINIGGSSLLSINTSSSSIVIGGSTNNITFASNGAYTLNGTAMRTRTIALAAEYAGAVMTAPSGLPTGGCSGASGNMTSDSTTTAGSTLHNYYNWLGAQGSTNECYDIWVEVPIPSDFDEWNTSGTGPNVSVTGLTSNTTNGTLKVGVYDSSGASQLGLTSVTPSGTSSWQTNSANVTSATGTWTPGGFITLQIRMQGTSTINTELGEISMTYLSKW